VLMPCKKALTLAKTLSKQPAYLLQFIKTLRHPVQGFFVCPAQLEAAILR
jgi:hypothetical protein